MLSKGVSVGFSVQGLSMPQLSYVGLPLCGIIPEWDNPCMGLSVHGVIYVRGYLCILFLLGPCRGAGTAQGWFSPVGIWDTSDDLCSLPIITSGRLQFLCL